VGAVQHAPVQGGRVMRPSRKERRAFNLAHKYKEQLLKLRGQLAHNESKGEYDHKTLPVELTITIKSI
jgi:hypothetical protein